MSERFDPDAAASPSSGVFGLPHSREEARVVLIPVPFDATTSYRAGTADGPELIRRASAQVDLYDHQFGAVYERGIHMLDSPEEIRRLSIETRRVAEPLIERGGDAGTDADREIIERVNAACRRVNEHVWNETRRVLEAGQTPGVVGGEHSVPLGAIRACAEWVADQVKRGGEGGGRGGGGGLGVLQIDAHMDLRRAYEGFQYSHASIMYNVLAEAPGVTRLVQVGIRDFGAGELALSRESGGRVRTHFDLDWARQMLEGRAFTSLAAEAISVLPEHVYVSFDIDGLDPGLCPHTGTPVPGGLSFSQAALLLEQLKRSGRTIVGFDLNEVAPNPSDAEDEWDGNVGARVLYKLCGLAGGV